MLIELGTPEVLQNERLGHHPAGAAGIDAHSTPAMHAQLLAGPQRLWKDQHDTRPCPRAAADPSGQIGRV
jgi:hypothetical protein